MNTPQPRLPSMAPAYMSPTNTPIHFGVMPRSGASTGARTAGADDTTAVKIWIARVATSATSAVFVPAAFTAGPAACRYCSKNPRARGLGRPCASCRARDGQHPRFGHDDVHHQIVGRRRDVLHDLQVE